MRPKLQESLLQISQFYEIIVFTASHRSYADTILDYVDPNKKMIHHRIYRENCIQYSDNPNVYFKDLRVLNRDLKNTIIVDNAPYSFALQLENGYPIIPCYDCKDDEELKNLAKYLLDIANSEDIRANNREKFKMLELMKCEIGKYVKYYQITGSDMTPESIAVGEGTPPLSRKINSELMRMREDLDNMMQKSNGK